MLKILKQALKGEIFYIFIFLGIYLSIFISPISGVYFLLSFLYVYIFTKFYESIKKRLLIFACFYIAPIVGGYYFYGLYEVVGFLIGSSIASFVLLNKSLTYKTGGSIRYTNIALTAQVSFTFFYFYTLVIQDIRGQNKMNENLVILGVASFLLLVPTVLPLAHKFLVKKIDTLSFSNILLITGIIIAIGTLYTAFLEIGSFNVILPASFVIGCVSIFYFFTHQEKHFKLKRTISTIVYSATPLLFTIYFPWNTSKFLGSMFAALASIAIFSLVSVTTNTNFKLKYTNLNSMTVNVYLFLMSLFFLSSKGIITRINIAEINYLIAVIFGIVVVVFFEEFREAAKIFTLKLKLENIYSVLLIGICITISYVVLDIGGVETLGSLLFGIIGYLFIKNNISPKKIENKDKGYVYLENNLLNLLTVFTLSLILTKL